MTGQCELVSVQNDPMTSAVWQGLESKEMPLSGVCTRDSNDIDCKEDSYNSDLRSTVKHIQLLMQNERDAMRGTSSYCAESYSDVGLSRYVHTFQIYD
jgi:hypothetical protein